jgi:hypothetical protein
VRAAIIKFLGAPLESEIHENAPIQEERLSEGQKGLRRDMIFELTTGRGKMREIVEFLCPCGHISDGQDTLEAVCGRKLAMHHELAKEVSKIKNQSVTLTAVVVSAMGAVCVSSRKALKRLLDCSPSELPKLGRQISAVAILGSFAMSCMIVQTRERGVTCRTKGDEMIKVTAHNMRQHGPKEEERGGEEEDAEKDTDESRERKGEDEGDLEEDRQRREGDEDDDGRHGERDSEGAVGAIEEPAGDEDQ